MSTKTVEDDDEMMLFGLELSEKELYFIGTIVALWGALEYEIFGQTLLALNPNSIKELPKEMNNMQPSQVLELWKTHVVDNTAGKRGEVLNKQYQLISHYANFRHAIVHGMWDWSPNTPETINVSRVRKDTIQITHFTADDLKDFALELGKINFKVKYPGGTEDHTRAMVEKGSYMSRRFAAAMTGSPVADDLFPKI
jgi:hypothetical protein